MKNALLALFLVAVFVVSGCTGDSSKSVETDKDKIEHQSTANAPAATVDSNSEEATEKQLEILDHIKQYGEDGFTSSGLTDIANLSVQKKDNVVYAIHRGENRQGFPSHFYLSIAINGKWTVKDKLLLDVEKTGDDGSYYGSSVVVGNSLYHGRWKNDEKDASIINRFVQLEKFNDNGDITSSELLCENCSIYGSISTSKGQSAVIDQNIVVGDEEKRQRNMYFENTLEPIALDRFVSLESVAVDVQIHADLDKNLMYYSYHNKNRPLSAFEPAMQYDLTAGKPVYNEDGQDLATEGNGGFFIGASNGVHILSLSDPDRTQSIYLGLYDDKYNLQSARIGIPLTVYKGRLFTDSINVTETEDEIHIWHINEFRDSTSLELVKIQKQK
ncbi:hypothetical protein [Cohnella panacarvi]|uniref:hypothetical protein n=1 Tax=Cohnella panacarvi TaxID=400776 RepID=UPI00047B8CE2|nr:hypothetical protein [Cohnella panacarvi]